MKREKRVKRFYFSAVILLMMMSVFSVHAQADSVQYSIGTTDSGVLQAVSSTGTLTDTYVALKNSASGYSIVQPLSKESVLYYFDANGAGRHYTGTGYVSVLYKGTHKKYWANKGRLLKDQIVGNKESGYRYVDETGIVIKNAVVQDAVNFVVKHSKDSDSNATRLRSCYQYLWKHYRYKRFYGGLSPKANDMRDYAQYMFDNKCGNCHRYAACFAYIAKVLGYDSKVAVGSISGRSGGMTPHGWTLVKNGKRWLVCDPDMELNGVHDYMKVSSSCRTATTRKCTLTIKNGVVKWK